MNLDSSNADEVVIISNTFHVTFVVYSLLASQIIIFFNDRAGEFVGIRKADHGRWNAKAGIGNRRSYQNGQVTLPIRDALYHVVV